MKSIIYISMVILLASCTKDFLQRNPLGQENNATFYKNETGCNQGVSAIYDPLQWLEMYSRSYWAIGDVCSDDAEKGGQNASDQPYMQSLQTFNVNPSNAYLADMWDGFYVGIGRANQMLSQTNAPEDVDFDNNLRLSFRAEARFLRAFYYFDLMKIFGAAPLVIDPLVPGEGADVGNRQEGDLDGKKQQQAILDFVIAELEDIKDVEILKKEKGRVTNAAVRSLLAKAYIWNKDWTNALTLAEQVINSSPAINTVKYQDIFSIDNEDNSEIIFAIQFVDGDDYNRLAEGTERCTYQNVRLVNAVDVGKVIFLQQMGYGFNTPRQDLVDVFDPEDPRLDMMISRGDSLWFNFNEINPDLYPNASLMKHPINFPQQHTGYYCRKGTLEYSDFSKSKWQSSGLDYPMIRLADVYLFAAEAAIQSGQESKALQYVNAVRERARNSARKETGYKTYVSLPESKQPADLLSITLDDVYKERRRELYCEGHSRGCWWL